MTAALRIAVDVTPIRTGGANGGAKPFVLELLTGLARRGPHTYTLLTASHNDQAFAEYDAHGVSRLRVDDLGPHLGLHRRGFHVLFCPMTAPNYAERGVATVCTLYDLQHLTYPWFFTAAELAHRTQFYQALCARADAVVAISEFSRSALIHHFDVPIDRTSVVRIAIHQRLAMSDAATARAALQALDVPLSPFAFYPANFWSHKNHRFLLLAFARFLRDVPDAGLHLVLTGDLLERGAEMRHAIGRLGLSDRVHVLGFVSDAQLAALWREATLLVFPSLYEGFGIPVLEALQFGKPVLCSREGSLPEVGGEDVTYFDARNPQSFIDALTSTLQNFETATAKAHAAQARLAEADPATAVEAYARVLERAAARPSAAGQSWTPRVRDAAIRLNARRRGRATTWMRTGRAAWRRGDWPGAARAGAGAILAPGIAVRAALGPVAARGSAKLRRLALAQHWILRQDTKRWLEGTSLHPDGWAGPVWEFDVTLTARQRVFVLRGGPPPVPPTRTITLRASIAGRALGTKSAPASGPFLMSWSLDGVGVGNHTMRITSTLYVVPDDVLCNGDGRALAYRVISAEAAESAPAG